MICILNCGIGNVNSLAGRIQKLRLKFVISNNSRVIKKSKIIIIPGVGNSSSLVKELKRKKLFNLLNKLKKQKKIIGLCAGMQIFADNLEEGGEKGFGWIKGDVVKLDLGNNEFIRKMHNVGWNRLTTKKSINPKINGLFYFNHAYSLKLNKKYQKNLKTYYSTYKKKKFLAMFIKKNLFGIQFHPERSNKAGLKFLNQILN